MNLTLDWNSIIYPLLGGALIGIAVTGMLAFNGRVTGISGIISSSLSKPGPDGFWRWCFLVGMVGGGVVMNWFSPQLFLNSSQRGTLVVVLAGLFVGYGTVMGSGCTSGHGVCGISRFSVRSLTATFTFMFFGFIAVMLMRFFNGEVG